MKIILREDVRDLGRNGELLEVKDGFARNYLLPRKLAVLATEGNVRDYKKRIAVAKEREEKDRTAANSLADELKKHKYVSIQRVAEGTTRLHGSVTNVDVAALISAKVGTEIDRRDVDIKKPIRSLGEYQVNVKLMRGMTVPIQLIVADREPVEEVETPPVADVAAAETGAETDAETDETSETAE